MSMKLSTALSTAIALVALIALTLGLYTLFRGNDESTVGVPTTPYPTKADEALWEWVDAARDKELAHQTTTILQRQLWWEGEIILFTYQDRLPDSANGGRQEVLGWVLAEPEPLEPDWTITMSGSTRDAIRWTSGTPDFFWLTEKQDSQGRTMSVIYGLWFGRAEKPETLKLTWNGEPLDVPLYNDSFLHVAEAKWEERPTIAWDCDVPEGDWCGVVLRTDEPLPEPEPLVFADEIRYDGQNLDPLTGQLIPFTLGERDTTDLSAPGKLDVPANAHFVLNWQVVAPPSADWRVFVHLMGEAGELVMQSDVDVEWPGQPCPEGVNGPECVITTEHGWSFPTNFPPGLYTIVVGLYDPQTGERALVTNPAGRTSQVTLGQVQIVSDEAVAERSQVTLHIFSGRPDPTWPLTPTQEAELRQRLKALPPTGQSLAESGGLGYSGFSLLLPAAENQPEQQVDVWEGVVRVSTEEQVTLFTDEERALERWLLDTAAGQVEEEIVETVRRELEPLIHLPPTQEQHGFAIYLVDPELSAQDLSQTDLGELGLEDTPILSLDDVLTYTWETHEMTLTDAAYERIAGLEVPTAPGIPFVVCVDGEPVYRGEFWASYSSAIYDGIAIDVLPAMNKQPLRLQLGYPGPDFFTGEDSRADARILEALQEADKLAAP